MTSQTFTFIDSAGNQAQYTVYEADRHNECHWTTDHGDRGFHGSYAQAQSQARTALKSSMAARRRSDEAAVNPWRPFSGLQNRLPDPRGRR